MQFHVKEKNSEKMCGCMFSLSLGQGNWIILDATSQDVPLLTDGQR